MKKASPNLIKLAIQAFPPRLSAPEFRCTISGIRSLPTMISNLRIDETNQLRTSVVERFQIAAKAYFQLPFEAFDSLNHAVFPTPHTTASSSVFRIISGAQTNRPGGIQLGARLVL